MCTKFVNNVFQVKDVWNFSTDSTAKSTSLSLVKVDLRYVLIHFKAENDLWQNAELTQIVSAICRSLSKVEKASFRG